MYVAFTILAGILWGCISLFLKPLAAVGLTSVQIMFLRGIFSALMMLIFLLIKDRSLLKIQLKDLWMFVGTGVISLTFFSLCYFKTILEVGTSIAVILLYTSPVFILIMARFLFKEKITVPKIIALILTFAGCIFVSGAGSSNALSVKGFLIGLCAGFGYALYSIFSRYALKKYNSLTVTFYTFIFSAVSILPFCHINQLPEEIKAYAASDLTMSLGSAKIYVCFMVLGIALFCTVLPYIFYTLGLSGLETGKAAILVTVEPLVGTLIGFFVWKEAVSVFKITGIVLIFVSVVLAGMKGKSKTADRNKIEEEK